MRINKVGYFYKERYKKSFEERTGFPLKYFWDQTNIITCSFFNIDESGEGILAKTRGRWNRPTIYIASYLFESKKENILVLPRENKIFGGGKKKLNKRKSSSSLKPCLVPVKIQKVEESIHNTSLLPKESKKKEKPLGWKIKFFHLYQNHFRRLSISLMFIHSRHRKKKKKKEECFSSPIVEEYQAFDSSHIKEGIRFIPSWRIGLNLIKNIWKKKSNY